MMTPCTNNNNNNNGVLEANDQFLLCDEVWDNNMMSPAVVASSSSAKNDVRDHDAPLQFGTVHSITKQDCEHSFATWLSKEPKFMTGPGYINFLESNTFVATCRFKAIQWFIHSQMRFNLCMGTVFKAVNHLDRFMEINQLKGWSYWMAELLSLASLSIAIKFGETCHPSLHDIQDGLECSFEASLIEKMEMKILRCLGWEVNSITPHSYVELITWELSSVMKEPFVLHALTSRIIHLLLASSFDVKMLVYRPSVVAMSGLRSILEDEECLSYVTTFIPQHQQQNLEACYKKMRQEIMVRCDGKVEANGRLPSSPDTVLTKEQVVVGMIYEEQVDLSFIDGPTNNHLKRKNGKQQDEEEDGYHRCRVTKFKKCVN